MSRTRRAFIADLGKGVAGAVVLTSCVETVTDRAAPPTPPTSADVTATSAGPASTTTDGAAPSTATDSTVSWARADLGFVSAYVLVRNGEAAIVDTGVAGSEPAIADALRTLGVTWSDVGHVIVTHEHGDHTGSLRAVLEAAGGATGYAAAPDIGNIETPRPLQEVVDGDTVFGLTIIATPGHTAGHIAVLDPGRLLLTGDAINNTDGLTGPNPQFSSDMVTAIASARLLGTFDYQVALFGHGAPIETDASSQVAEMAEAL